MSALKVIGGILALVGAVFVLITPVLAMIEYGFSMDSLIYLLWPLLALIGGILGLAGKKAGGWLALIVGLIWVIFGVLVMTPVGQAWMLYLITLMPYLTVLLGFTIWGPITIEAVLVLVGGILILAGGDD